MLAVTVTNLNDNGPGSLRQAIADAPAGETIDFAVTGTIVLTSGQLVITNDLIVHGPGITNLTLSQNSANRILMVSTGIVSVTGLAIANGYCYDCSGGGILNLANLTVRNCLITSNFAAASGGGIANWGTLIVRDSLIHSNSCYSFPGGGIRNSGTATVIGSTICSNRCMCPDWIPAGGIETGPSLIVSNSTVSFNQGYGIIHFGGTTLISSSTLANNERGDLVKETSDPRPVTIRNSIITFCYGIPINSEDYNLIQSTSFDTYFVGATNHNIYGQNPKLGPLTDNGGPTPTHALRFDSPAIEAGRSGGAATDQRGLPRPIDDPNIPNVGGGDGCDIGAYESDPVLKLTGIEAAGIKRSNGEVVGRVEIRVGFNSVLGRNYRLESEGNLDNSWTLLSNNIAGTGSAVQTLNAGASNLPRQFYRVVVLP